MIFPNQAALNKKKVKTISEEGGEDSLPTKKQVLIKRKLSDVGNADLKRVFTSFQIEHKSYDSLLRFPKALSSIST